MYYWNLLTEYTEDTFIKSSPNDFHVLDRRDEVVPDPNGHVNEYPHRFPPLEPSVDVAFDIVHDC